MAKIMIFLGYFMVVFLGAGYTRAGERSPMILAKNNFGLSSFEKEQIFRTLELKTDKDTGAVLPERFEECGDVPLEVERVDLNKDGIEEIFVFWGNWCLCGHAGRCLALFLKNSDGQYIKNFDFGALNYKKLPSSHLSYPDLTFHGPGFCQAIWAWNRKAYEHLRNEPEVKGGCDWLQDKKNSR